jgi:hypothetical protein
MSDYLLTVGKLTQNAAVADLFVFSAFRLLSGSSVSVAKAIYYASDSVVTRNTMLRRVVEAAGDEQFKEIVARLISASEAAHKPRNELAHALYFVDEIGGSAHRLSLKAQTQPRRSITKAYLDSLMSASTHGRSAAEEAFVHLCRERNVDPHGELKV